jgi:RNA polymerase sigma-70 factor (family 1)
MSVYSKLTDEQLVALLKKGDQLAFAEIYKRYAEGLAGFASSKLFNLDDARDLLHDMFVKLWENREQIVVISNLQSFLFTVIRRRIIDKIRKNITREVYAVTMQSSVPAFHDGVDNLLEAKEFEQAIEGALDQLSPRIKEIYKLSREDGLSNRLIAGKLDLSEQTVKNQISAAIKHLRKSLKGLTALTIF